MATSLSSPSHHDELVAVFNQRLWWLLLGAGGIIAALAAVLCVLVLRPHSTPYVFAVNGKGEPVAAVQPFMDDQAVADNTIRWNLGNYIQQAFHVSHSFDENKMTLSRVYAMSTAQASEALTAYYRANHDANNPLVSNGKYWQEVHIVRTLKLPAKDTYQVDYTVLRHDQDHMLNAISTNWRATMRVLQGKPTPDNVLGVWATDLDFEPEAK